MKKMVPFIVIILGFFLLIESRSQAADLKTTVVTELDLTTPTEEGALTLYLKEVFKELGSRTGIKITISELPKKRALIAADSGQFDGMAARIKGMENLGLPNMRMVGISHFTVKHVVFAKRQDIREYVSDTQSLIDGAIRLKYRVAFLRGSKKALLLLSTLPEEYRLIVNKPEDAFLPMQGDRLGAFLGGPGIVSKSILKEKFSESGISEVAVLSETELFPYLHTRHAHLIPKIEEGLRAMREDGSLAKIQKSIE